MKLSRIEFDDFKSISEDSLDIEMGVTTLVGINEAGKTNVLSALEKADKKQKLESYDIRKNSTRVYMEAETPKLKLHFSVTEQESKSLKVLFGLDAVTKIILVKQSDQYSLNFPNIDYEKSSLNKGTPAIAYDAELVAIDKDIAVAKETTAGKKKELASAPDDVTKKQIQEAITLLEVKIEETTANRKVVEDNIATKRAEELKVKNSAIRKSVVDTIVKDYLPNFLFFDSVGIDDFYLPRDGRVDIEKLIASPNKYKQIVNLLALGGITDLEILRQGDSKKNTLRKQRLNQASTQINSEIFKKHWPLESIGFVLSVEETNILSIHLQEKDDDAMYIPGDRSRGLQWSVAFNIYFLSESKDGILKNSVLLIDEPGIFLHIDAQKKLLNETFPTILKGGNQIVYTTHLPYLIDPMHPERIRILEKKVKDGETSIGNKAWSEGKISDLPEPVKTALGTKWTEWFGMGEQNCIVEGPTDQIILRSLVSKVGGNNCYIPAYGKDSVPSALVLSKLDEKNSIGIIDNDLSAEDIKKIKDKLSLVNISEEVLLNIAELSEVDTVSTIEDVLPEHIYIDAVDSIYGDILSKHSDTYKKEDIPTTHPRIESFKKMYEKLSGEKGLSFKKMEVARAATDIIAGIDNLAVNDPKWTTIRKLSKNIEKQLAKKSLFKSSSTLNEEE